MAASAHPAAVRVLRFPDSGLGSRADRLDHATAGGCGDGAAGCGGCGLRGRFARRFPSRTIYSEPGALELVGQCPNRCLWPFASTIARRKITRIKTSGVL